MNEYNISAFIQIMQLVLAEDNKQETTGRLLLASIADLDNVLVDIDSHMISNLVKRNNDMHSGIKKAS